MTTPTVEQIEDLIVTHTISHPTEAFEAAKSIHELFCQEVNPSTAKFFEDIKEHFGVDVPEIERAAFLIEAGCNVSDLRWVLLKHPDQKMVESSCLHFLGDEAQSWWRKRKRLTKLEGE